MTKLYLRTTMKTSAAAGAEKQMIHIQNMIFFSLTLWATVQLKKFGEQLQEFAKSHEFNRSF